MGPCRRPESAGQVAGCENVCVRSAVRDKDRWCASVLSAGRAIAPMECDASVKEKRCRGSLPDSPHEPSRLGASEGQGDSRAVIGQASQPCAYLAAVWRVQPHTTVPREGQAVDRQGVVHCGRRPGPRIRCGAWVEVERAERGQNVWRRQPCAAGHARGLVATHSCDHDATTAGFSRNQTAA